jgi:GYF domain 2
MQIHIAVQGEQQGPFDLDTLNQRIANGSIQPVSSLAWYEGRDGWIPLAEVPGVILPAHVSPPPLPRSSSSASATDATDATGGIIPYKNPRALTAYYLGIFGLLPFVGILLAIPAVILGILGLSFRRQNPGAKGVVHAWVGIICGGLSIAYHLLIVVETRSQ